MADYSYWSAQMNPTPAPTIERSGTSQRRFRIERMPADGIRPPVLESGDFGTSPFFGQHTSTYDGSDRQARAIHSILPALTPPRFEGFSGTAQTASSSPVGAREGEGRLGGSQALKMHQRGCNRSPGARWALLFRDSLQEGQGRRGSGRVVGHRGIRRDSSLPALFFLKRPHTARGEIQGPAFAEHADTATKGYYVEARQSPSHRGTAAVHGVGGR
jgi:hypothetical protein